MSRDDRKECGYTVYTFSTQSLKCIVDTHVILDSGCVYTLRDIHQSAQPNRFSNPMLTLCSSFPHITRSCDFAFAKGSRVQGFKGSRVQTRRFGPPRWVCSGARGGGGIAETPHNSRIIAAARAETLDFVQHCYVHTCPSKISKTLTTLTRKQWQSY